MDRLLLTHLPVVLAVARTRSFARAAAELGLGASAVSHAVRLMEDRLGAPLFARTTRSVAVTEIGAAFIARAEEAMAALDRAVVDLREGMGQVSGVLRLNAPRVAVAIALTPVLLEMSRRHPRLIVEVVSDDALTEIVAERFDAGIRLGEMVAQDMVAVRLTPPFRAIMVAAPAYLTHTGEPTCLEDLAHHNCIGFRLLSSGAVYAWDVRQEGRDVRLDVMGTVRVSDATYARELAVAGLGIAYVLAPLVEADLASGALVEILAAHATEEAGLFLYFPQRVAGDARLRALLDVVRDLRAGYRR